VRESDLPLYLVDFDADGRMAVKRLKAGEPGELLPGASAVQAAVELTAANACRAPMLFTYITDSGFRWGGLQPAADSVRLPQVSRRLQEGGLKPGVPSGED